MNAHVCLARCATTHVVLERLLALDRRRLWRRKKLLRYSEEIRRDGSVAGEMTEILLTGDIFALHRESVVALRLLDGLVKY